MGLSFSQILAGASAWVQSEISYSENKINAVFTGLSTDLGYVTNFFKNEGPILISAAKQVKTDIDTAAADVSLVIPSLASEVTLAQNALDAAITLFENIVSGITQAAQQPSAAESLVMAPDPLGSLREARIAQSNLDVAKANAAIAVAKYGAAKAAKK